MIWRDPRRALLFTLPICVSLVAAAALVAHSQNEASQRVYQQAGLLAKVLARIDNDYVESFDDKKSWDVVYGGLKAMTKQLDPYSVFLTPKESRPFAEETHKNYVGVGFATNPDAPPITVDFLFADSPAEKAGLVPGDRVVAVNGASIETMERDKAIELIKGEPGTVVTLSVVRVASGAREEFKLERSRIAQLSVIDAHFVDSEKKVGYVYVDGFGDSTVEEFDAAVEPLVKAGMTALVVDLRDDGGGLLDVSRRLANRFLNEGTIVSIRYREPKQSVTYNADPAECRWPTLPLVLIVNDQTASAAEIVAGALQDHKRALLVGDRTYGKGVVQSIWKLPIGEKAADDSEPAATLKLTTAEYLTPAGRVIEKRVTRQQKVLGGLEPDVKIVLDEASRKEFDQRQRLVHIPERWREQYLKSHGKTLPELHDRQIDAALAVLRGETPAQDF